MPRATLRRIASVAVAGLVGSAALVGCSTADDSGAATSAPPTSAAASSPAADQVCADADATRASLQAVVSTEVIKQGTSALKTNFATFKSDAQTLLDSTRTQFAAEGAAVKDAIAQLETAIGALAQSPSVSQVAALAKPLAAVKSSTTALLDAVNKAC